MDNNLNVKQKTTKALIRGGMENKLVEITYRDKNGNVSTRKVEPYEVRDNAFFAFCLDKGSIRRFNFDSVIDATLTTENYVPRWPVKM